MLWLTKSDLSVQGANHMSSHLPSYMPSHTTSHTTRYEPSHLSSHLPPQMMRSPRLVNNLVQGLALSVLLSLGLSGCFFRDQDSSISTPVADTEIEVASDLENKETQVKLTVPDGWRVVRGVTRGSTDIYATYQPEDLYASVLSESDPVLDQFDIEDNAQQYRWLIEQELDKFEGETRTGLTSLDSKPAVQYEMRGVVDGVPVVYLHTTVEGRDRYYQVVGWTTESSYQQNKETLGGILKSFRGS